MAMISHRGQQRIAFIDIFRFSVVSFALLSHFLLTFSFDEAMSAGTADMLKLITRSATPALMIMFGMMMELVYARRFDKDARATVAKLLSRAVICYLCFVVLAVTALAAGLVSPARFLGSLVLLKPSPNANIFMIYAMLLPLCAFILMLDRRRGSVSLIGLIAAVWALDGAMGLMLGGYELPGPFAYPGGFLLAIGNNWGPSILHASFLVAVGMIFAKALLVSAPSPLDRALALSMALAGPAVLGIALVLHGPIGVRTSIVEYSAWRAHNAPGYYAFGITATLVLLGVTTLLYRLVPMVAVVQGIGQRTMAYFLIGNALLLIAPPFYPQNALQASMLVAVFFILSIALTLAWAVGPGRSMLVTRANALLEQTMSDWVGVHAGVVR